MNFDNDERFDPRTYAGSGGAAVGLIDRIRALQQPQAAYRPGVARVAGPLTDRIARVESGGRANIANDRSSALGAGQFLRKTWLDMLAKYRPDLTGTADELAALRKDPRLSAEMVEAYAAENAKRLARAGYEPTPGNVYLAHFAGPSGALKVLGADPAASARSILGDDAVTANPFLDQMTIADLRSWADRKMRTQASAPRPQAPAFPDHADPVFGAAAFQEGLVPSQQGPSSNALSRPAPDAGQEANDPQRGLVTNAASKPLSVQPPIFFPF